MVKKLKNMVKLMTPPGLLHLAKWFRSNPTAAPTDAYGLSGDYRNWDDALAASTGYNSVSILETTRVSLLKVKNGEAVHERDSVLLDKIEYTWPVLAGLMYVAARCGGKLNVLDFGGSLGSTYFQNRVFLSALSDVRWNVVEQLRHVEIGRKWFEDDRLRFYATIADCMAVTQPNTVLLSGALQYVEHPYKVLEEVLDGSSDCIIIDRTPFWNGPTDRLCVQTVPPEIYSASYPGWIFSMPRFAANFGSRWKIAAEFESLDRLSGPIDLAYRGMIVMREGY